MSLSKKYVSIDKVLADLSTMIDEQFFDQSRFKNWTISGLKKLGLQSTYSHCIDILPIIENKVMLPDDMYELVQVAYKTVIDSEERNELLQILNLEVDRNHNASLEHMSNPDGILDHIVYQSLYRRDWMPILKSTNTMFRSVLNANARFTVPTKSAYPNEVEYNINNQGVMTLNIETGYVMIAYMSYAKNEDNEWLIPDDQDLIDALIYYVLYRYWMSRSFTKEDVARSERNHYLQLYQTAQAKVRGKDQLPDLDQLEIITRFNGSLVAHKNLWDNMFTNLNKSEHYKY